MTENGVQRKLRTILAADVKRYSRLMGENEVGTCQTLTSYLTPIRLIISEQKGRVFSSPGDTIMAEFASMVDAVRCPINIQPTLNSLSTP